MSTLTETPSDWLPLIAGRDMTVPGTCEIAGGRSVYFTCRSPEKAPAEDGKSPNDDAVLVLPTGQRSAVLAIADGLGGQPEGGRAARMTLDALRSSIVAATEPDRGEGVTRQAILNGFDIANRAVQDLGVGAGTTLAVVEIDGATIRSYHAGDSTILVCGQRGRMRVQTVAHSPVGYAVEAGVLGEHEAMHHEERHIVFNLVGHESMRIEMGPAIALRPRDTVLLASDGLSDNLLTSEIIDVIRKGPIERAGQRLAEMVRQRMSAPRGGRPCKPDDLSFVLFRPIR